MNFKKLDELDRKERLYYEYYRMKLFLIEEANLDKYTYKYFVLSLNRLNEELTKLDTAYFDELDYLIIEKLIIYYETLIGIDTNLVSEYKNMKENDQLSNEMMSYDSVYNIYNMFASEELQTPIIRRKK